MPNLNDLASDTNQDDYIKNLKKYLEKEGNIDLVLKRKNLQNSASVLFNSIDLGLEKIVQFALDNEADMTKDYYFATIATHVNDYRHSHRTWNPLELAVVFAYRSNAIYETIKSKALEKFSIYGLQQIHFDCAKGDWPTVKKYFEDEPSLINKAIDVNSPLWAGMTPLLIAAKFYRKETVVGLLNLGASPKARDPEGNTPLHFLFPPKHIEKPSEQLKNDYFDQRLFIFDQEDTFGSFNGLSHFHIAVLSHEEDLSTPERYLKLGFSPDPLTREINYHGQYSHVGERASTVFELLLHRPSDQAVELLKLLLMYGADADQKNIDGRTPLRIIVVKMLAWTSKHKVGDLVCLLLEAGANSEFPGLYEYTGFLLTRDADTKSFLHCVKRLEVLNEKIVTLVLSTYYKHLIKSTEFDEFEYGKSCLKELKELNKFDLRREIDNTTIVKVDFKSKFRKFKTSIGSHDISEIYPMYGDILQIKLNRRLIEFEKKRKLIDEAAPNLIALVNQVTKSKLFDQYSAEHVLWNLNLEELKFNIREFNNENNKI